MFHALAMGTNDVIHMGLKGNILGQEQASVDYPVNKLLYTVLLLSLFINIKYPIN